MTSHYNILMIDAQNEVIGSACCDVRTDDVAVLAAQAWLGRHAAIEIWQGPRLVAALAVTAGTASRPESAAYETGDGPRSEPDFHLSAA